jgi:hypothetical protein
MTDKGQADRTREKQTKGRGQTDGETSKQMVGNMNESSFVHGGQANRRRD